MTVFNRAGIGFSDRVEIIWNDGVITKKWLSVMVKANADTAFEQLDGYPEGYGDVFYFGN